MIVGSLGHGNYDDALAMANGVDKLRQGAAKRIGNPHATPLGRLCVIEVTPSGGGHLGTYGPISRPKIFFN